MNKCTCIALACFFYLPYVTLAQKSTDIEKGKLYLSPGIGVFSVYSAMRDANEYKDYSLKVPFISASLDIALTRHWTVGPYLAYFVTGHDSIPDNPYHATGYEFRRYQHYQFGSKTTYHFHVSRKISGHTGLILGYQRTTHSEQNTGYNPRSTFLYAENPRRLFLNIFVGALMPVSKNIAAFAELGSYVTFLRFGCSVKLK